MAKSRSSSPFLLIYRSQYVQVSLFSPPGRLALTVNLSHQYSSIWLHENFIVESLRLKGLNKHVCEKERGVSEMW